MNSEPAVATAVVGNTRETIAGFTIPLPCFFPVCLAGTPQIPSGPRKRVKQMGRCQTETYYATEVSYLKSVLLWLQEYWTGPAVRIYPLRTVPQASLHYSVRGRSLHQPTGRDNRSAHVLAARNLATYRQANDHYPHGRTALRPQHGTARPTWLRLLPSPLVTSTQKLACMICGAVLSIWRKPWLRKSPRARS